MKGVNKQNERIRKISRVNLIFFVIKVNLTILKGRLLSLIRPVQSNIFDRKGLKSLAHQCVGLSHLNQHRFRHNFWDCMNPLCSCSLGIENTSHYLLYCHYFSPKSKIGNDKTLRGNTRSTQGNHRNTDRNIQKHQGKRWEAVRKPGKYNIKEIAVITTKICVLQKATAKWIHEIIVYRNT